MNFVELAQASSSIISWVTLGNTGDAWASGRSQRGCLPDPVSRSSRSHSKNKLSQRSIRGPMLDALMT